MEYGRDRPYEIGLVNDENTLTDDQVKALFNEFIDTFRIGEDYIYREELAKNEKLLRVTVEHMSIFDTRLFESVMSRPLHYLEIFRGSVNASGKKERHIEIVSQSTVTPIRKLDSAHINKISTVRGIVLSVSNVCSKPLALYIFCRTCLNSKVVKDMLPRKCESCSGTDSFVASPEKSILQDIQYIKIQEAFEDLPTGEIARHLMITAADGLVDRVIPGSSVTITGVYSVGNTKMNIPYIKAMGISVCEQQMGVLSAQRAVRKVQKKFTSLSRSIILNSISPEVFGHKDVKLALACALFGGIQKSFEDGIRVRGDINVLLLGDPGIAKSQLLKFLSGVSTRGVYTSGKGASAAGLTATVCKDRLGNFYLEGGALVLADGGLCCIDEFDKMQEKDRVAIHEAMEQQTISISKAGIVTSLNSRCAVVAAANPIFGRYDENKAPGENIDFGVTILSRFDLIFVIKDSMTSDKKIAEHVIGRFMNKNQEIDGHNIMQHLSIEELKDYAEYARTINPVIEDEAAQRLRAFYIQTRKTAHASRESGNGSVPITVRQLEAIARISEALARMELESVVTTEHVEEAIRLFTESTMKAVAMGHYVEGMPRQEWIREFSQVEAAIKVCLPVGLSKPYRHLVKELCRNYNEGVVMRCLDGLIRKEKLCVANGGKTILRMP
ncbi:minichromosome maintenance deficient protein 5 [Nematocida ausubeli]|uniref:DNA helicase n=1 Tax=Nematocida ausubeli (strain ATCC PRA-371 / ERTm2) TaxID=1913371 RepID=H8ZAP8_NEMA1|nr:minichromosome maintenance deficient protein 5 [Nematocida ausubeli]